MKNILIVEDEKKMSAFIKQGLIDEGYSVKSAESPTDARNLLVHDKFDLIILDVMLPEISGFEFAKELRTSYSTTLILMLTALNTIKDKIQGLDSGADDYLSKPFDLQELLARVRALLRRNSTDKSSLQNGQLEMNLITRQVIREGMRIELTTKEFSLLELLMRNVDKVLDRNAIARQVWGAEFDPDSNVIDVYINHLRKKIDSPYSKKILKTVVGQGYVLNKME